MRILTITNMWPTNHSPYYGIFVKEQVEALKKYYPDVENQIYFINGKSRKTNYLLSVLRINWFILIGKYDVIHIHYALSGLFLLFNPFIKCKIFLTLHGSDFNNVKGVNRLLIRMVIEKVTDIIYLNNKMLNGLRNYGKHMHHIPCGVDFSQFRPIQRSKKESKFKIAFPSSKNRPEKNYVFFEKVLDSLRVSYGYEIDVIEIHGKSREEVNSILNDVDVLCMTSISEGSPQVIKEALCCNTPIVSSNVGDVAYVLSNVENTYVINEFVVKDFSASINAILLKSKSDRRSNGREKIMELGLDHRNTSMKIFNAYNRYEI